MKYYLFGLIGTCIVFLHSLFYAESTNVPVFQVPSFNFEQLNHVDFTSKQSNESFFNDIITALESNGVVAVRFEELQPLRAAFLKLATKCILEADSASKNILSKVFEDGTVRYTISSADQSKQDVFRVDSACSGYDEAAKELQFLVHEGIRLIGKVMDSKLDFKLNAERRKDKVNVEKIIQEGKHLNHFHAYKSANSVESTTGYTLNMHTDTGFLIGMLSPEFYLIDSSDQVENVNEIDDQSGLVIQLSNETIVRPIIQADQVFIMLGEGATQHNYKPVVHAMNMPRVNIPSDKQLIRAWFGRMILLPTHETIPHTSITYGDFIRESKRYLLSNSSSSNLLSHAICPQGRVLTASDNACTVNLCNPKNESIDMQFCKMWCNHGNTGVLHKKCQASCECNGAVVENGGSVCWMICAQVIPEKECSAEFQVCNKDTAIIECQKPSEPEKPTEIKKPKSEKPIEVDKTIEDKITREKTNNENDGNNVKKSTPEKERNENTGNNSVKSLLPNYFIYIIIYYCFVTMI